ncbi:insulinase family protein [Oceanobacillus sp. 143]|uniref:Peptidase M16 n=1 Tax=Oceanobacillus zhaokaii TaxID=2052660 RepID=A0A345PGL1_9BACI|nr:pitrilysin family protein [Oceanobacillus zhaokaii]AXI09141.1 peptidase M16 [Oceanobacillus zhaokaii]QGS68684.1 insulinase family protein [Oceanobacillus sp. 143]
MLHIEERRRSENGLQLHFVQSKKYKTLNIVAKLRAPLDRETITKRALLPYILNQGSKRYPNKQELQLKLDDLYGAVLSVDGAKKGDNHIISVRLELANPKFIPGQTAIIDEGIRLFSELLLDPNVSENSFDEKIVNREKNTLKSRIQAVKDDKMNYANMRLIDAMCEGEAYQLHVHGYEEDLQEITAANLYEYYQTLIIEDSLDIYVLGDFDEDEMSSRIASMFERKKNQVRDINQSNDSKKDIQPKEVIESEDIQQAKLHIGYRTNTTFKDEDYAALQVFNGIFGGFPNSKLFINVREKNSLAYYASSRIESHKGLLFVFSGIAPKDYEKAKDIIQQQMEAMKKGDFTETDLQETKDLIINQLLETMDHSQGLIELLYQQVIGDRIITPEQLIANIKQVTKEQVTKLANIIEEDTVYLLTNEGGQTNE